MAERYYLNENDRRLIAELIRSSKQRYNNPLLRRQLDEREHQASDLYLAKTPAFGISGLIDDESSDDVDLPGQIECFIYRVLYDEYGDPYTEIIDEARQPVLNFSTDRVPGNAWIIIAKEKFGSWFVVWYNKPTAYIARTPDNGITALAYNSTGTGTGEYADDVPGQGECSIFRVVDGPALEPVEETITVYNFSSIAVGPRQWVVVVQEHASGLWVVPYVDAELGTPTHVLGVGEDGYLVKVAVEQC